VSPVRSAARAGARLFLTYAVFSLVPVLVLGVVLARGNSEDAVERGLSHGRAQAAVVQQMAIAPALHGGDLALGLSTSERVRLQTASDLAIFRGSIMRLRIRDFGGDVVFADDGSMGSGASAASAIDLPVPADDPAFRSAAGGGTEAAYVDGGAEGRAIRVLQPIISNASGRSVGVLELVLPYDAVADEVQAAAVRTYWRLGGGLAVLYVVLAGISWSTTRRLRREAAAAAHAALHDPLTGLPNRELFGQRLEELVECRAGGAVVLVDLDRFKEVNDGLGHQAGDQLLRIVGQRLAEALRAGDTVARLGGDEFGLLLPELTDATMARELVQRISDALSREAVVLGVPVTVEASFGIALHPDDGATPETLLTAADAAMYHGKRGAQGIVLYDRALPTTPAHHLSMQHDIRRAIEEDELVLEYQPQIDLATGECAGVEALVRWDHPQLGRLGPATFLPAVEQSAVIAPLTEWVLRRALADCVAWTAQGRPWRVAVNLSARNLEQEDFAASVVALATAAGVPPQRVHLEMTETALPADLGTVSTTLAELRAYGFGIALDDFGVGYASLSHLRTLELTEVKIDRAFVAGVDSNDEDREVVRSLVQLAHGLGLSVCAEGVETAASAEWLLTVGCDAAQGYHFSRPRPWHQLAAELPSSDLDPLLPAR
jgi:diguanylate cyclase